MRLAALRTTKSAAYLVHKIAFRQFQIFFRATYFVVTPLICTGFLHSSLVINFRRSESRFNRRLVSSVGRAPVFCERGRGFEP